MFPTRSSQNLLGTDQPYRSAKRPQAMCNRFIAVPLRMPRRRENDQTAAGREIARDLLPRRPEGQQVAREQGNVVEPDVTSAEILRWLDESVLVRHRGLETRRLHRPLRVLLTHVHVKLRRLDALVPLLQLIRRHPPALRFHARKRVPRNLSADFLSVAQSAH